MRQTVNQSLFYTPFLFCFLSNIAMGSDLFTAPIPITHDSIHREISPYTPDAYGFLIAHLHDEDSFPESLKIETTADAGMIITLQTESPDQVWYYLRGNPQLPTDLMALY